MIAYISPLVPKKTGIALYSHHLIKALQTKLSAGGERLDVYDDDVIETNRYQSEYQANEILPLIFETKRRQKYRQFIYHFGNNPLFHLPILRLLQQQKGIVVLHDTVLYYLIAGQGNGGLWRSLAHQTDGNGISVVQEILTDSPNQNVLLYPHPERYPLLKEVLDHAMAVVVHSKLAEQYVRQSNYQKPIYQVPLIDYQQSVSVDFNTLENAIIKRLFKQKTSEEIFLIGVFGFGGATKRSKSIFLAISELPDEIKSKLKLVIIGTDLYQNDIDAMGLSDQIICTGYVNDTDFDQGLALCDLIINLRYPSMGETSAVQIQAMSAQKPTIVSNHGWFSELPDNTVHKIAVDNDEIKQLKQGIIKMICDETFRLNMAHQAKVYVSQHHNPQIVANQWIKIISDCSSKTNQIALNKFAP